VRACRMAGPHRWSCPWLATLTWLSRAESSLCSFQAETNQMSGAPDHSTPLITRWSTARMLADRDRAPTALSTLATQIGTSSMSQ
jgi:hypothetical protein